MKSRTLLCLLAIAAMPAMPQPLWIVPRAVIDNGTLYFTSTLGFRATNAAQGPSRAFSYSDADGVHLLSGIPEGVTNISASADGSVLAVTFRVGRCTPFNCSREATTLRRAGSLDQGLLGRAIVSANGRWLLVSDTDTTPERIDLSTGQRSSYPRRGRVVSIASEGTALVEELAGPQYFVWTRSDTFGTPQFEPQFLDDSGSTVYYAEKTVLSSWNGAARVRLHRWSVATRDDAVVAQWDDYVTDHPLDADFRPRRLSVSRDGGHAVFLASDFQYGPSHAWVVETGNSPRLLQHNEDVVSAALSGDGRFAFLTTVANRVLSVNLASGGLTTQVIDPTPVNYSIWVSYGQIVTPGAFLEISGPGFPDSSATSLPIGSDTLAGVSVKFGGKPAKILSMSPGLASSSSAPATPGRIEAQAPWDLGPGNIGVDLDTGSPFSYLLNVEVRPIRPLFYTDGYDYMFAKSYHGNPPRQVGVSSPIGPGETVTAYLAGLGPVSPAVEAGYPAPANPPSRLIAAVECGVASNPFFYPWPDGANVEVLWAGLAPGTYGVYQAVLRWPMQFERFGADPDLAMAGLGCRVGGLIAGITVPVAP